MRYYLQGPRHAFFVTRQEVVVSLLSESHEVPQGVALSLRFLGANPDAVPAGDERAAGDVSYFLGNDPSGWHTGLPRYGQIVIRELWPGVDLRLREQDGTLKYEFEVQPGSRVADIALAYGGSNGVALDDSGALLIETDLGVLRDRSPVAYQTIDGQRVPVDTRYVLQDEGRAGRYGFTVGGYRRDEPLVIDPGLEYATFLGGSSHEIAAGIDVDAAGNAYVVGMTQSPDFPTRPGSFKRTGAAGNFGDVFVSKLNAAGTALVYSTFIGGGNFDWGRRIAIDAAGNAYVTGQTKSSNFPTTGGAFDRTFNIANCPRCGIDQYDTFVTKLNAAGSALVYSTFIGGTDFDDARGIAVDGAGNAYVTGETLSSDFPTTAGSFDRTRNGEYDVFLTKLNAAGSALVYSTFLGGTRVDNGERVVVDAAGAAYVMGFTSSTDLPTTAGAFDTTANGAFDVFVTKVNAAGSALVYSTFLGGQGSDGGGGLDVDAAGSAYVSGGTGSPDFPTTPGAFDTIPDSSHAFVTKLNAAGSALVYSTVLGGTGSDGANGVAVDGAGRAWLTGVTNSLDFPVTSSAAQSDVRRGLGRLRRRAERRRRGPPLLLVSRRHEVGERERPRGRFDGRRLPHGSHVLDGLPRHAGRLRHRVQRRPRDLLGRRVRREDRRRRRRLGAAGAARRAAGSDPAVAVQWRQPAATRHVRLERRAERLDLHDSGRYVERLRGSSRTRPECLDVDVRRERTGHDRALLARSRCELGRNARGLVRRAQLHPTGGTASRHAVDDVDQPGDRRRWCRVVLQVVLSVPAPEGGALITLSSSHPAVASVPTSATVPAHGFTATFAIATTPVTTTTSVTITANYNNTTRTALLTVTPPAAPATLQNLTLSTTSVAGGSTVLGTVILSGAAPQGGAAASLASSNAAVVGVPPGLTVPQGATAATFSATTSAVSASTTVTISATYNGTTRTTTLTVTPSPPPPPPPQTATLTVTATGRSGERVTSTPAGINVATGSSGSASYTIGTSITLSVSNGRDAIWSGACSSGGDKRKTCTFSLTGTAAVTANVQ